MLPIGESTRPAASCSARRPSCSAVVWWNSAFENRASKRKAAAATAAASGGQPAKVDRSQSIGRGAGRLAGTVAKSIRDRQKSD